MKKIILALVVLVGMVGLVGCADIKEGDTWVEKNSNPFKRTTIKVLEVKEDYVRYSYMSQYGIVTEDSTSKMDFWKYYELSKK